MKYFTYGLAGFSTAQLLAFIGTAYAPTSQGVAILYLAMATTALALGFLNWAKGRQKNPHNESPGTVFAAFSGSIVLIAFLVITAFAGIYIATGGF